MTEPVWEPVIPQAWHEMRGSSRKAAYCMRPGCNCEFGYHAADGHCETAYCECRKFAAETIASHAIERTKTA